MPVANAAPSKKRNHIHSHTWIVGVIGLVAGTVLMMYVPSLKAVSNSLLLFAGFHLVGAVVLLGSAYVLGLRRLLQRVITSRPAHAAGTPPPYDFGWGPEWMNGLAVVGLVAASAAVAIQVSAPQWWPLAYLILLLGASFFVGNSVMRAFRRRDHMVLPLVNLLQGDHDRVLDAGCGAGRTTIALSRGLREGTVVAVDRFDADYIDGGGRELLARNLRTAQLTERVTVETADLAALPFDANTFDSAVSTNVFDHLGPNKQQALHEVFRVLKPGGRFLMAVWVPGGLMFAIANIFAFFLTSKRSWRAMAQSAGFRIVDEGVFNYAWFVVMEKPTQSPVSLT